MLKLYYSGIEKIDTNYSYPISQYRKEKLSRQSLEINKKQGLAAELLLQCALRDNCPELILPPDIVCLKDGKPILKGGELCFSLSHSGNFSACIVSEHETGLDIQIEEKCRTEVVKRFFSKNEEEYIFSHKKPDYAFTEIWCKKEAYLKAKGLGLKSISKCDSVTVNGVWHTCIGKLHIAVYSMCDNASQPEITYVELPECIK